MIGAKYLATRDTPIVDWTGELIGENWRANWVRAAKYILYCAPYEGDSVDKVRQAWYGSITLEGHVPENGAPAKFGEVDWSYRRADIRFVDWALNQAPVPDYLKIALKPVAYALVGLGGEVSERDYAWSILINEYGYSRGKEITESGEYWLPTRRKVTGNWISKGWEDVELASPNGSISLLAAVKRSLARPFDNPIEAAKKLLNNPMFQAAVRLAYWVATHIPFYGRFDWFPFLGYCNYISPVYYEGPAAPLLFPDQGWVCADHAALAVALYRGAGLPGYVVGGEIKNLLIGISGGHAWTAVFVYDEDSGKWHEVFIDPTGPAMHYWWEYHPIYDNELNYDEQSPYGNFTIFDILEELGMNFDYFPVCILRYLVEKLDEELLAERCEYTNEQTHRPFEFSIDNWKMRVNSFNSRFTDGKSIVVRKWYIDNLWDTFKKSEWSRWRVRERRDSFLAPGLGLLVLILLTLTRRWVGVRS